MKIFKIGLFFLFLIPLCLYAQKKVPIRFSANAGVLATKFSTNNKGIGPNLTLPITLGYEVGLGAEALLSKHLILSIGGGFTQWHTKLKYADSEVEIESRTFEKGFYVEPLAIGYFKSKENFNWYLQAITRLYFIHYEHQYDLYAPKYGMNLKNQESYNLQQTLSPGAGIRLGLEKKYGHFIFAPELTYLFTPYYMYIYLFIERYPFYIKKDIPSHFLTLSLKVKYEL